MKKIAGLFAGLLGAAFLLGSQVVGAEIKELKGEYFRVLPFQKGAFVSPKYWMPEYDVKFVKKLESDNLEISGLYLVSIRDFMQNREISGPALVVRDKSSKAVGIFLLPYAMYSEPETLNPMFIVGPVFLRKGDRFVEQFKKVVKFYRDKGLNLKLLDGNRGEVYVVGDVLCPKCAEKVKALKKLLREKGYSLYYVPYAAHGEYSLKAFSCLAERDAKKFAENVEGFYRKAAEEGKSLIELYVDEFKSCKPSKEEISLFQRATKTLADSGIKGVPFVLTYEGDGWKWKIGIPFKNGREEK